MKKLIWTALLALMLSACAGERYHSEGVKLVEEGESEKGLASLAQAMKEEPDNVQFRLDYELRRDNVVSRLLTDAQSKAQAGKADEAEALYRRVLALDAPNRRAREGLEQIARSHRSSESLVLAKEALKAGDADRAQVLAAAILAGDGDNSEARTLMRDASEIQSKRQVSDQDLRGVYGKPINLEFRDANVKMVFEVLARTTAIGFILDKDVRPDLRTTVFLHESSLEDAVDLILQTSQLQKKVLNRNTVLIYPNTPEKLKEYQELVMKAFYLQNADVKQVQNTLKTLLKTKDMVIDEKLNLIVMRDTPEAIRLAEKLVALHDLAEPEVMLEMEVLEVQRDKLNNIGIQWPSQLSLTPLSATGGTSLTLEDLKHLDAKRLGASISGAVVNLQRQVTDANLLANPRVRVRNREIAKILIGDKVPTVTTTTTATGLVSDSIQYLDVGLKLDVQPDIRIQDEVSIKVGLEVSNIVKQVTTPNGNLAYQIGTRTASTVLRLKDGETQILAGLINDNDRSTANRVPGLGDIPILGRLFGATSDDRAKTEIVLSITPHLIRNLNRPVAPLDEFWSGTEANLRTRPVSLTQAPRPVQASGPATTATEESASLSNAPRQAGQAAQSVALAWRMPAQAKVGDEIRLPVRIKADGEINSLHLQLGFDAQAFQVLDVAEGDFFNQNNGNTTLSKNVDVAAGKLFLSLSRSDVDGAVGEGTLATVTLRVLKLPGEIKLLAATPVVRGDKAPAVGLPAPQSIAGAP
jgi:general secretion pathway protein D